MTYDIIIIGAGVAGLRVGIETLHRNPHLRCIILEKYNVVGGRINTYHTTIPGIGKLHWENGAGRISHTHKKVLALMKQYQLEWIPISKDSLYLERNGSLHPNRFSELHDVFIEPLRSLPLDVLQTHTLGQVSDMVIGKDRTRSFYNQFPYFSEIHTIRADHAIQVFDHEMKSMAGFGICKGGLSLLIDGMVKEFESLGGSIERNQEVISVSSFKGEVKIVCMQRELHSRQTYIAPTCVMALPSDSVKQIRGVSHLPVLERLVMTPLLRMYAVFPVKKGKSWFSDLSKIVTNDPIRYIIPIDQRTIMISYTDGEDATFWLKQDRTTVQDQVMKHIRSLFPDRSIPDPIFFKMHAWKDGCTYWKPGRYNIVEESKKSLHPDPHGMPGLFLCGESFAVHQCWIESAIDQADQLLDLPAFKRLIPT